MSLEHKHQAPPQLKSPERIAFVIFDGVEEMDVVGPWEMFQMWNKREGGQTPHCVLVGTKSVVTCAKGMRLVADATVYAVPEFDTLLVPGGPGTRDPAIAAEVVDFLRNHASRAQRLLSVCTGAHLLEQAGLLKDAVVTTHWRHVDKLLDKGVKVVRERYVQSGNIWTSAGVSAGVDLALAYIKNRAGAERAGQVQLDAEYFPSPTVYDPGSEDRGNIPPYVDLRET